MWDYYCTVFGDVWGLSNSDSDNKQTCLEGELTALHVFCVKPVPLKSRLVGH